MPVHSRAPQPGRKRNFFELVGKVFDQRAVDFLIPDLERDLEMGVYITMARARFHSHPDVQAWYDDICEYFSARRTELIAWRGQKDRVALQRARSAMRIREPEEVRLGYAKVGSRGHGIGGGRLQDELLSLLLGQPHILDAVTRHPDVLSLARHFGLDRVSDVMVGLGKRRLIAFTQWCVDFYGFDRRCLSNVVVPNVWNEAKHRFENIVALLPVDDDGKAILLVPADLVRSSSPLSASQYFRDQYGAEYQGERTKDALLGDAAAHPGRLEKFARERLKDPERFKPRKDLRPKSDSQRKRRRRRRK